MKDRQETGQFYFSGNLNKYYQDVHVFVLYPIVGLDGKKLPGKIVLESCMRDKETKEERDHFSIRITNVGEAMSLITSLTLAIREYVKMTSTKQEYIYAKLCRLPNEVYKGDYDIMLKE